MGTNKFYFFFVLLLTFGCSENDKPKLPYIGNYDVEYKKVNGKTVTDTIYPTIPEFFFQDEYGKTVSNKDFKNKIWIVEFFFATCPTICPIMTTELKRLNKELANIQSEIQFISFTIDPKKDSSLALLDYKKRNGINAKNWTFLRGDEAETHRLGIENFQTFAGRDDEAEGGFAHSGAFTLVDRKGYVRGVYAVTGYDGSVNKEEYERLKTDIKTLLKYEYNVSIP